MTSREKRKKLVRKLSLQDKIALREKLPYRRCAGVALFNKRGEVWLGRRIQNSKNMPQNHLWQMPQGGIDKNEKRKDAAKRELWEETGVTRARKIKKLPGWIYYDLPDEMIGLGLKGKYRGQRQAWFAYLFEGDDDEINISKPPKGAPVEFDDWRWAEFSTIADTIVPFKRKAYLQVIDAFGDLPKKILDGKFS